MAIRVLYRHGPFKGQVEAVADEVYANTLLQTGYAVPAPAVPEPKPAAMPVVEEPKAVEPVEPVSAEPVRRRSKKYDG